MADLMPVNFALPGESVIASYDSSDLADAESKVNYYLYSSLDENANIEYRIGRERTYSREIEIRDSGGAGMTYTFYSGVFNVPKVIRGTLVFSYGWIGTASGGETIDLKFYKYSAAGVSTQLGNTWTKTDSNNNMAGTGTIVLPKTKFAKGDKIKVELIFPGGGLTGHYIGIDPMDRDGTYILPSTNPNITSQFILMIPFDIDN